MARYGKTLLQRLTFQYCDLWGSSRGLREYLDTGLSAFAKQHPHVRIDTVIKRNRFPFVRAEYALLPNTAAHLERQLAAQQQQLTSGQGGSRQQPGQPRPPPPRVNSNTVGVKHQSAQDIRQVVWWLSQSQCRPRTRRIPSKHVASRRPSIQGAWTATTF